jgi:folate-binding protein YgfZ
VSATSLLFDLAGRGSVVLAGRDRASFLHGLVTNDVKKLRPGQGCAAAFLTAKGKLLAECVVLCEEDRLVLDTPPELSSTVENLLRTYLVFNDVAITNETSETHVLHLTGEAEGNGTEEGLLGRCMGPGAGVPLPREPHASAAAHFTFEGIPRSPGAAGGGAIRVVREDRTGGPGWDLRCPSSLSEEIRRAFLSAGARIAAEAEFESLRVAAGIPRWGAELTESVLPDEAGLRERGFVAENKGCYVGQEIVARIKTYGHVNRLLVRMNVAGGVPRPGEKIFFESEECGAVTSAAARAVPGESVALAYVKRARAAAGTALTVSSFEGPLSATVVSAAV